MTSARTFSAALLGAAVVALCAAPASAQIVNVQNLAGKAVDEGLSGSVSLRFDLRMGNTQILMSSAGLTTFYKMGDDIILFTARGAYGLKGTPNGWNDEPYIERIFEHVRYRRELNDTVSVEAFGQHEYDRWRRLRIRTLAGAGPRFDVPVSETAHAAFGIAYMFQGEELLKPKPGDIEGFYAEHRLSSYITGSMKLTDNAAISGTIYAQPRLDDWSDIRSLIDGVLTVALTRKLGLSVKCVLALDSRPPEYVRGYDLNTRIGFSYAI